VNGRSAVCAAALLALAGLGAGTSTRAAQLVDPNANNQMLMQMGGSGALQGADVTTRHYDPHQQYQLGLAALKDGKFSDAERAFDRAVTADPNYAEALAMRGVARSRQGQLNGAARDLSKALKMDPTLIAAVREYGVVLAKLGETDKAKAQLGILKLQAEGCAETCPDAASLKDAAAAVEEALDQPSSHS
jgi:Tfp pilus assembly protein PilF